MAQESQSSLSDPRIGAKDELVTEVLPLGDMIVVKKEYIDEDKLINESELLSENHEMNVEGVLEASGYVSPDTHAIENEKSVIGDSYEYILPEANTVIKEEFIVPDLERESVMSEHSSSDADNDITQGSDIPEETCNETSLLKKSESYTLEPVSTLQTLFKKKSVQKTVKKYCDVCEKAFSSLRSLSYHKRIHNAIKKHPCDMCNKAFVWPYQLTRHKLMHSGIRKYKCDECNKDFPNKQSLTVHKVIHTGIKKYKCEICDKAFTQASGLCAHRLIHGGTKKHKCDICNLAFYWLNQVVKHKLVHTGIKNFQCDICNKTFTWKNNLTKHKLTHTG